MAERTVAVASSQGLHARPAALFAHAAATAGIPVTVTKGGRTVNAASILSVIGLGVNQGDEVTLASDDAAVVDALAEILLTNHDA